MEQLPAQIETILDHARSTERPNFQQLSLAVEECFALAKADVCSQLRLLMTAKLTNPPLPELKL